MGLLKAPTKICFDVTSNSNMRSKISKALLVGQDSKL